MLFSHCTRGQRSLLFFHRFKIAIGVALNEEIEKTNDAMNMYTCKCIINFKNLDFSQLRLKKV